ncbi:hypothetical protein B0H12DRAFT_1243723 [Mycena haematopus]|nr:hypothetical protein B0H12DRAFT_1243723 [Mycena haematopus]
MRDAGNISPYCKSPFFSLSKPFTFSRTRIRDPVDQALAHFSHPRYKDLGGDLYIVCRRVRVVAPDLQIVYDDFEIKAGISTDVGRRQCEYRDVCRDVEFVWFYKYHSDTVKLLERLVHLSLRALGAAIPPYPCPGCGVRHREFFDAAAAGGIAGVCAIVEFWLEVLGQRVVRVGIDPIA